jgi:hypothetical protein
VAVQRIMMKHFIGCFGCKFTVPEASINKLAVDLVPPIVGAIEPMDNALNCWCKDLVGLVCGQIAGEHKNRPAGFSCLLVDLVIGADHGQGSFCADVKVITVTPITVSRQSCLWARGNRMRKRHGQAWHWHSCLS